MTRPQGCELLTAVWSSTAILAFSNGHNIFGWIAVCMAVLDFAIGVYIA